MTRVDENVSDRDLPPSTPAVLLLNVAIVTHTSKGDGDVQQLYDEKTSILRVSSLINHKLVQDTIRIFSLILCRPGSQLHLNSSFLTGSKGKHEFFALIHLI